MSASSRADVGQGAFPTRALPLGIAREGAPVAGWLAWANGAETLESTREVEGLLHPAESARLAALPFFQRRRSYLLGRVAAKRAVVAALPDVDPTSIEIGAGVFGQPLVHCGSLQVPELSLSHSRDLAVAVAAQAGHCVGIDLEHVDPGRDALLEGLLTPTEFALARGAETKTSMTCWHVWTIKEALSKALKCGLTVPWPVLGLDSLVADGRGGYEATFANFGQYRAVSWGLGELVVSLALPRRSTLSFDPRSAFVAGE